MCAVQFYLLVAGLEEGSGNPILSCPCTLEAAAMWGHWAESQVGLGPGCYESALESFLEEMEPLTRDICLLN